MRQYGPIEQVRGCYPMQALSRFFKMDSQMLFNVLLGYYVAIQFFLPSTGQVPRFSTAYFTLVLPVLIYTAVNFRFMLTGYSTASRWMLGFGVLVSLVSIARADFATMQHALVLTLPIVIILNSRIRLDPRVVNNLFAASVVAFILISFGGVALEWLAARTEHELTRAEQPKTPQASEPVKPHAERPAPNRGLLPSLASGEVQDLNWRVSLFALVPESAFFSILVVLINLFFGVPPRKYLFIVLGTSFALLSGIRATTIVLILILILFALSRFRRFNRSAFYALFFTATVVLLVTVLSTDILFYVARSFDNEWINTYLYRSPRGLQSADHLRETLYRGTVWQYHLRMFLENPLWGHGTFTIANLLRDNSFNETAFCSSCSFLTEWAARIGFMIIPFVVFIGVTAGTAIRNHDAYSLGVCLTLIIVLLTWGSLFVPYNPVFLLLIAAIGTSQRVTKAEKQTDFCP